MTQANKTHLPSLFILLALGLSAALLFLLSLMSAVVSLLNLFQGVSAPATEMINAAVFLFEALLVGLCAWFVLQKTMGSESAEQPMRFPFSNIYVPAVLAIVLPSLAVGALAALQDVPFLSWVVLPVLTILVIGLPVWLLLGIGGRGVELGARWRFFGILGLGLTLSPFVMIALEIIVLVVLIAGWVVFIAAQPDLLQEALSLAESLRAETDQEIILKTLAPYLLQPGAIAGMLLYVSVFVPLIEEFFKPLALWFFAKSLDTPAQGFALGLLSGAAFALLESLNAGADGSPTWGAVVSVRAATTLLHVTASGLVGWGIASMFKEKRVFRFIAAFACASAIHGLWNACALTAGLSSVGYMVGAPAWLFNVMPAALGGMGTLGIGMLVLLAAANRKLRSEPAA